MFIGGLNLPFPVMGGLFMALFYPRQCMFITYRVSSNLVATLVSPRFLTGCNEANVRYEAATKQDVHPNGGFHKWGYPKIGGL